MFLFPRAMIPDTVEYSEWRTGLRQEGILYGCFFFCFKLGAAIAVFLAGIGLDLFGYAANVAQTQQALFGIRLLLTIVPAFFIVLGVVLISFYPINKTVHQKILIDLQSA